MIGAPLQAEVVYFDKASAGSVFHHGTRRFVFRNVSLDRGLKIRLPALAVYDEVQPNNFHRLANPVEWPEFARKHTVLELPPGGVQVFEEMYEGFGEPVVQWCFVFGARDGDPEREKGLFAGCVVAPGRSGADDLELTNDAMESGGTNREGSRGESAL
jgi:hypothetical protein